MNKESLREEHRLEWENIVISLINQGWLKSSAKHEADEQIEDRYGSDEDDDNDID